MRARAYPSPMQPDDRTIPAPADLERLTLPVRDAQLGALRIRSRTADAATAPLAVLLPGIAGAADDFLPLLGPLADRGVTALALSQRGQRGSTVPAHAEPPVDTDGFELAELGLDVHRVLDALVPRGPVHLLGHSFGGLVGLEAVIRDPARWTTYTHWNSGPRSDRDRSGQISAVLRGGGAALWNLFTGDAPSDPGDAVRARIVGSDSAQLLAALRLLQEQPDRTAELRATGVPVLVAHGSRDDAWPHDAQRRMAEHLDARYEVIADAGHDAHRDQPRASAELLAAFWGTTIGEHPGLR
jgi:pimeloyl-ACP methyl ester carboxylesterase